MITSGVKSAPILFAILALLFCVQALPRIQGDSLTADEPTDITNGYYYLTKGDTRTPHNHPPVAGALTAWPLLFMNLKSVTLTSGDVFDRAHQFLFNWNLDHLGNITFWTRLTSLGLGLGVGFLLFWVLRREPWWFLGALGLWAFDPLLGAFSGLAKTDIAPTFFFFLAVLAFQRSVMKTSLEPPLTAGVLTALAVGCKFYGLVLLPLFALLEWFNERERFKPRPFTGKVAQVLLRRWVLGGAGFLLGILLLYLPATFGLPDHPWPWNSLTEKLGEDLSYAAHPHPVFFMGQAGFTSHWFYLPCAFAVKEPVSFLVLLALVPVLALKKRVIIPAWQWVPPFLFALALLGAPNLGVRYLLPAFPFLFLLGGRAFAWMFQSEHGTNARAWRLAALGFLAWQALSVGLQAPRALSYFNDWVPSEQKMFLLGDSNLDWGQDLKRLATESGKRKWGRVKLAYYGAVDPKVYGLDWEPWNREDLKGPQSGTVYAVNASFFQLAPIAYPPTRPIAQSWIRNFPPTGKVGDTWFYFEIHGDKKNGLNTALENKKGYLLSAPFLQTRGYAFAVLP